MASTNKEKILEMKKKGYSYRSISFILGVPLGPIKPTVHFAKIVKLKARKNSLTKLSSSS